MPGIVFVFGILVGIILLSLAISYMMKYNKWIGTITLLEVIIILFYIIDRRFKSVEPAMV